MRVPNVRQNIFDDLGEFALMPDPSLSLVHVTSWLEVVAMLAASESHCASYSARNGCWMIDGKPRFVRSDDDDSRHWRLERPACVLMRNFTAQEMRYLPEAQ